MTNNSMLEKAAIKVGTAMGKADRAAHKVANATEISTQEFAEILNQLEAFQVQLEKSKQRLRSALK